MKRIFKSLLLMLVFSSYSVAGVSVSRTQQVVETERPRTASFHIIIPKDSLYGFYYDRVEQKVYEVIGLAGSSAGGSFVAIVEVYEDGSRSKEELLPMSKFRSVIEIDGERIYRFKKLDLVEQNANRSESIVRKPHRSKNHGRAWEGR